MADGICGAEARDAGFAGSFVALRSDDATPAANASTPASGTAPTASSCSAASRPACLQPVHLLNADARGNVLSGNVWSGALRSLHAAGGSFGDCSNWTAASGFGAAVLVGYRLDPWSAGNGTASCATPSHVYCFQQ